MKNIVIIISCIIVFTFNAYSELTESDLNKIRLIIKEEIETAIDKSEKRMKHYVDYKVGVLDAKTDSVISRLDSIEKLGIRNFQLILALMGFVTVVVGIPQIIVIFQNRKYKAMLLEI